MQTRLLSLLLTLVALASDSNAHISIYLPTVTHSLFEIEQSFKDIYELGSEFSDIKLSNPTIIDVESVIESYYDICPTIVTEFENFDANPSRFSDLQYYEYLESQHSSLRNAVAELQSVEAIDSSWSYYQQYLQAVARSYPYILYDLSYVQSYYYSSLYSASQEIELATFTSPSIVSDFLAVYSSVQNYPSVSYAIGQLSDYFYLLPSSVDSDIISLIYSPSTVAPSEVSYVAYDYSTAYAYATFISSFLSFHPSIESSLTSFLEVASSLPSLSSAVSTICSNEMPTLTYDVSVMSSVQSTWSSVIPDLSVLSYYEASSPTLSYALSTLEQTFYDSPSLAYSLYYAIVSPSTVIDSTAISVEELSHQSFISALSDVISFEYAYPSEASALSSILSYLTQVWQTDGTLLTVASYLSSQESPSTASALYLLSDAYSYVSSCQSILSDISSVTYYYPSLSSYESIVESYAYQYPSVVPTLWSVITDVSAYTSSASYYASLEASYDSVVSALEAVYSYAYSYQSLYSIESDFISAAESDSSLLSDYSIVQAAQSEAMSQVCSDSYYSWWSNYGYDYDYDYGYFDYEFYE